jgi:threonine 3-dehydrogenase
MWTDSRTGGGCATIAFPAGREWKNPRLHRGLLVTTPTMKALRKLRAGRGAQLENVPIPTIGPNDVLVRVRAASICGTDLHIYGWDSWSEGHIHPPLTFGHEFCGVIEKIGEEVAGLKPGDFVSAEMHVNCGHCLPCRLGQGHICQQLKIIGIDLDGCFAQFVRIPARNVWKMDPSIPVHYAAVMDPLGNAVHTVLAGPVAGQTVAVTGCGPIGLMSIAVARACGAATVVATELNEYRRGLAAKMGADAALDPSQTDVVARVKEMTGGAGVDVLLEMSGHPEAIRQGLAMLRPGGRASLLGIPKEPVTLDLFNGVIGKGIVVQGIFGRRMFETWVEMTALLKSGRLNLEPLFHEQMPLEQFEQAFTLLEQGRASKVLLFPNGPVD